jgi:hypothetical protein
MDVEPVQLHGKLVRLEPRESRPSAWTYKPVAAPESTARWNSKAQANVYPSPS